MVTNGAYTQYMLRRSAQRTKFLGVSTQASALFIELRGVITRKVACCFCDAQAQVRGVLETDEYWRCKI